MKSLLEAVNEDYYKVVIEAIDYNSRESFYEEIYLNNLKTSLNEIVSKAVKQFDKKYKGKAFVVTAKFNMNNVNF